MQRKLILLCILILIIPISYATTFEIMKIENQFCNCDMQCSAETICISSLSDTTILTLDSHIKLWIRDAIDNHYSEGFCGKILMKLPDHTRTDLTKKYIGTACREPQVKPKPIIINITQINDTQLTTFSKANKTYNSNDSNNESVKDSQRYTLSLTKSRLFIMFLVALVYAIIVSLVLAWKVKGAKVCPNCKGRLITYTYKGINSKRCENCEYRRRV